MNKITTAESEYYELLNCKTLLKNLLIEMYGEQKAYKERNIENNLLNYRIARIEYVLNMRFIKPKKEDYLNKYTKTRSSNYE